MIGKRFESKKKQENLADRFLNQYKVFNKYKNFRLEIIQKLREDNRNR